MCHPDDSSAPDTSKRVRPDGNAALLNQFVSMIPGPLFEKSTIQVVNESESNACLKKDTMTHNLVHLYWHKLELPPALSCFLLFCSVVNGLQPEHSKSLQPGRFWFHHPLL